MNRCRGKNPSRHRVIFVINVGEKNVRKIYLELKQLAETVHYTHSQPHVALSVFSRKQISVISVIFLYTTYMSAAIQCVVGQFDFVE